MVHRKIGSIYRGRGVGTGMLRIMEDFLRQRAEVAGVTQVLSVNVAQIDVLLWLLKNGYGPFTHLDQEKVELLLSGDDSLVIKTDLEEGRDWYVFQKEILKKKEERKQGIDFMRDSVRMTLKKSF